MLKLTIDLSIYISEVVIIYTLGKRIRFLRKKQKLTQGQLSELIGRKISSLSDYENDKFEPSIQVIIELSNIFNVSTDFLLLGKENILVEPKHEEMEKHLLMFSNDIELLKKITKLDYPEKMKVEGIIDGILISKDILNNQNSKGTIEPK